MRSNLKKVIQLFKPDKHGYSNWVKVERFTDVGLNWSKNGNIRRNKPWGIYEYQWDIKRHSGGRSRVVALRTVGTDNSQATKQSISSSIRHTIESQEVCNLSLLPISKADKEVDHRWGYKEHPRYQRLNDVKQQRTSDFQLLHRSMNLIKRERCKQCRATNLRHPHPYKDFIEGSKYFTKELGCHGCFLAQPERYR